MSRKIEYGAAKITRGQHSFLKIMLKSKGFEQIEGIVKDS
jgi:hypothetical protein